MSNSDIGIVAAVLGVGGFLAYLIYSKEQFTAQELTKKQDLIQGGGEMIDIGQGVPVNIPTMELSKLSDDKALIRTVQPKGEVVTYKVDLNLLTPSETRALNTGLYDIDESTGRIEYGIIPGIQRSLRQEKNAKLAATGFKETKSTIQYTPKSTLEIKPVVIQKKEISSLDNKSITRKIDTTGQITTYKGTKTQVFIGSAIDKVKKLLRKK